jgi:hypothetical protein
LGARRRNRRRRGKTTSQPIELDSSGSGRVKHASARCESARASCVEYG